MIVDSSVLLNAFFPDEQQSTAQSLIQDYIQGKVKLSDSILAGYEITNAIRQAERRQRINQQQVTSILTLFEGLNIPLENVDLQTVLFLARQFNRTAYDAAYLALALSTNDKFITGDLRLYNAVAVHLDWVLWIGDYSSGISSLVFDL